VKLYKTTEYAIRVLTYMAKSPGKRYSTMTLHKDLSIPYKYLGRLMTELAQHGFIKVEKGKYGGYEIKNDPSRIYLSEVIDAIEGKDNIDRCILGFEFCNDNNPCPMHRHWMPMKNTIMMKFRRLSILELAKTPHTQI
jgi:Rrf2 family transcriptional regulator, iron-sulfur cluster assembly transcription factor